jgi:hypothetical protein
VQGGPVVQPDMSSCLFGYVYVLFSKVPHSNNNNNNINSYGKSQISQELKAPYRSEEGIDKRIKAREGEEEEQQQRQ